MPGTQNSGKGGKSGKASNAALDDNEDLMAKRGRHFRAWADARRKRARAIAPADMLCHYPNSPKPPR